MIPKIPIVYLFMGAGGGSHAQRTAKIMTNFEALCPAQNPDSMLVVGAVNSPLACCIVGKKPNIPVAHVEAVLRSGDMSRPEEVNRLVTDSIPDWFFVPEPRGAAHLRRERKPQSVLHYVGVEREDSLLHQAERLPKTKDPREHAATDTVDERTNRLTGTDPARIVAEARKVLRGDG